MISRQFLRKASLLVSKGSKALELGEFRFTFNVKQADIETPNTAVIRVFNLSDDTSNKVGEEFDRVILQVGYEDGRFGVIFDGTIKQARRGRESAVDSFLELSAADGDQAYTQAVTNLTLEAGSTPADRLKAVAQTMEAHGVVVGYMPAVEASGLPRGRVLYGMSRDMLRQECSSLGLTWSIQNGQLVFIPLDGVLPGEAVVLNAATGMIGWPEQTDQGIRVRTLINPAVRIGCTVKIDNRSIQLAQRPLGYKQEADFANLVASVPLQHDGLYRVYVANHAGDSRGNEWYSDLICLTIDGTIPTALAQRGQA